MRLVKKVKVGAAVAGTALLAIGAWMYGNSGGSTEKATKESKARGGGGSGSEGDEHDEDQGLGAGLMAGAAIAGVALRVLRSWMLAPSRNPSSQELHSRPLQSANPRERGADHRDVDSNDQNLVETRITIMSYNIWSRKDKEVQERMKAIGCLIQKHSPDVIFFQEVTPYICEIFQNFEWWKTYEHPILPRRATKLHSCMLLYKLPVKASCCIRFENSPSGRELHSAFIEVGMGKRLVVATSHLKRSNFPSDTHSTERMTQAKKALNFLDLFPNAVFGGDMNWDEDSDGPFPLLHGWVDAWARLNPGEDGWTFDTKSNQMLRGRKPLQKRLDRFVCKLKDFKLIDMDIIGKEAIPGVSCSSHMNNTVPALPSDHFGLLLTISYICNNGHAC